MDAASISNRFEKLMSIEDEAVESNLPAAGDGSPTAENGRGLPMEVQRANTFAGVTKFSSRFGFASSHSSRSDQSSSLRKTAAGASMRFTGTVGSVSVRSSANAAVDGVGAAMGSGASLLMKGSTFVGADTIASKGLDMTKSAVKGVAEVSKHAAEVTGVKAGSEMAINKMKSNKALNKTMNATVAVTKFAGAAGTDITRLGLKGAELGLKSTQDVANLGLKGAELGLSTGVNIGMKGAELGRKSAELGLSTGMNIGMKGAELGLKGAELGLNTGMKTGKLGIKGAIIATTATLNFSELAKNLALKNVKDLVDANSDNETPLHARAQIFKSLLGSIGFSLIFTIISMPSLAYLATWTNSHYWRIRMGPMLLTCGAFPMIVIAVLLGLVDTLGAKPALYLVPGSVVIVILAGYTSLLPAHLDNFDTKRANFDIAIMVAWVTVVSFYFFLMVPLLVKVGVLERSRFAAKRYRKRSEGHLDMGELSLRRRRPLVGDGGGLSSLPGLPAGGIQAGLAAMSTPSSGGGNSGEMSPEQIARSIREWKDPRHVTDHKPAIYQLMCILLVALWCPMFQYFRHWSVPAKVRQRSKQNSLSHLTSLHKKNHL